MDSKSDAAKILSQKLNISFENALYKLNDIGAPQVIKPGHTFMDVKALNEIIRLNSFEKK